MKNKTGPDIQFKKKSTYKKQDPSYCANCGVQVSNAGRAPRSGRRYCSKPECQAARARANYRAAPRVDTPEQMAPTECSNPECRASLPPRRRRVSDDPLGRWCRRPACKRHQAEVHRSAEIDTVADLRALATAWENSARMIADGLECERDLNLSQSRVRCPVCNLNEGLEGWKHQDQNGAACVGLITPGFTPKTIHFAALSLAYPVRTYDDPEEE